MTARPGRTVLIGDVHGCADELDALLTAVAVGDGDRVVMVGDTVNRGPYPHRVLQRLRSLGARSVRGNHEDRLLRWRQLSPTNTSPTPSQRRLRDNGALRRTADDLDEEDWAYIEAMPLWIDLSEHGVRVVHAGVLPGRSVETTDPRVLMYIRRLDDDGGPSERNDGGVLWADRYVGPPHVCFGHNALVGLQVAPHATGLDTGCVYGQRLTAMVLPPDGAVPSDADARRASLVSVPARRAYYPVDTRGRRPAGGPGGRDES
ncbi:MAG: metallophosphoesterase [Myxococcota bacterium]